MLELDLVKSEARARLIKVSALTVNGCLRAHVQSRSIIGSNWNDSFPLFRYAAYRIVK